MFVVCIIVCCTVLAWKMVTSLKLKKNFRWLTPVIPALWEARVGGCPEVWSSKLAWPNWWNPISTKNIKISWESGQAPVIPATQKAESGESLEPERQVVARQDCVIAVQPGWQERLRLKKKKKKNCALQCCLHSVHGMVQSCWFLLEGHIRWASVSGSHGQMFHSTGVDSPASW